MEQDHREKRKDGAGPQIKEKRWSRNHIEKRKDGAGTTEKRGKMEQST